MATFVALLNAYMDGRSDEAGYFTPEPYDGAVINALLKISRIAVSPAHRDNWVDLAGYAAIGWECVEGGADG